MSMLARFTATLFVVGSSVLALHAVTSQTSPAAVVSGSVAVNRTTIALKHGRAYGFESATPGSRNVALLLADRPIDESALRQQLKIFEGTRIVPGAFSGAWASMFLEKKLQGIAFTWGADKQLMLNDIYAGGQESQFSLPDDSYVVTLKELTDKRISGTIKTVKPRIEVGGNLAVGVDATFDVPVGPLPK